MPIDKQSLELRLDDFQSQFAKEDSPVDNKIFMISRMLNYGREYIHIDREKVRLLRDRVADPHATDAIFKGLFRDYFLETLSYADPHRVASVRNILNIDSSPNPTNEYHFICAILETILFIDEQTQPLRFFCNNHCGVSGYDVDRLVQIKNTLITDAYRRYPKIQLDAGIINAYEEYLQRDLGEFGLALTLTVYEHLRRLKDILKKWRAVYLTGDNSYIRKLLEIALEGSTLTLDSDKISHIIQGKSMEGLNPTQGNVLHVAHADLLDDPCLRILVREVCGESSRGNCRLICTAETSSAIDSLDPGTFSRFYSCDFCLTESEKAAALSGAIDQDERAQVLDAVRTGGLGVDRGGGGDLPLKYYLDFLLCAVWMIEVGA